jgi:hypothetical protein
MNLEQQVNDHPQRDPENASDEAVNRRIVVELPEMRQTPVVCRQRLDALVMDSIDLDLVHVGAVWDGVDITIDYDCHGTTILFL